MFFHISSPKSIIYSNISSWIYSIYQQIHDNSSVKFTFSIFPSTPVITPKWLLFGNTSPEKTNQCFIIAGWPPSNQAKCSTCVRSLSFILLQREYVLFKSKLLVKSSGSGLITIAGGPDFTWSVCPVFVLFCFK